MNEIEKRLDKSFTIGEDSFLKWNCKDCEKENRNYVRDVLAIANLAMSACYDCGKINVIDLKTNEVLK